MQSIIARPRVAPLMLAILAILALGLTTLASTVSAQETTEPLVEDVETDEADGSEAPLTEGDDSTDTDGDSGTSAGDATSGGLTGLSIDLTLADADIETLNLDDTQQEYVIFTFRDTVRDIEDESGFSLHGFSAQAEAQAESARLIEDTDSQVLVGFAEGTDLRQYTVASVDANAVTDRSGEGNQPASTELDGSSVSSDDGRTAAPDLIGVSTDDNLERVQFTFDEELDDTNASFDAAAFGFATTSGNTVQGSDAVTIDDEYVVVEFDDEVEDAAWFFVDAGAVTDRQGIDNTPGGTGDDVSVPQLESVKQAFGSTQYDFTFDENISNVDATAFVVYSDSGTAYTGDSYARVDADTVRIGFPDTVEFDQEIVLAAVTHGAATSNTASETENVVGAEALGSNGAEAGRTSGPDLDSFNADNTGQVIFRFDEELAEADTLDANGFYVLTDEGDLTPARAIVEIDDHRVIVSFDQHLADNAEAYVINAGTLTDTAGDTNTLITIDA